MSMPILRLYESNGAGLVICCNSGVLISNQTGGTACLQPEVEGVYVPIRNEQYQSDAAMPSLEAELSAYFLGPKYRGSGATNGIDEADAGFIESVLMRFRLHPPLSVDRGELLASHEAWIHVLIHGDESSDSELSQFAHFAPYPRKGTLTWCNSD